MMKMKRIVTKALAITSSIGSASSRRLITAGLISAMAITACIVSATGALFTDTSSVGANTFSTGTIDISTSPASAVVSFSGMAPGDKDTAPVTVANDGSLQLRYAVTSTTTEDTLAAQLNLIIKTGVTTCTNAGFDTDGTLISGPRALGSTSGDNIVGDPAQGADSGDRNLAATASETLCVQVSLPSSSGNAYQNLTTTATFDFQAEQVSSNP